jgi:hypothetical protein
MEALHTYFSAERQGGLVAALLGVAAFVFSGWLASTSSAFRAMVIPLALIGLVQLGIGVTLWVRTPMQVSTLVAGLSGEPTAARSARGAEISRMERVMKSFVIFKSVELLLIAVGLGLIFLARQRGWAVGLGMGLLVQAAVMLAFDVFAEARAEIYLTWLRAGGTGGS